MSVRVMTKVWDTPLPDSEKIVLLALADWANDEGSCWPSIATLARKCSKSERTVQAAIKSLCDAGHLTRHENLGKGCNYNVHPRSDCTPTPAAAAPPQPLPEPPQPLHPTPAAAAPNTSMKHQDTPLPKRAGVKFELPEGWSPEPFGEGTNSRKIVDEWPPGRLEFHLEQFHAHHGKKGDKFKDWQKAWSTWVLNSEKFGRHNGNGNRTSSHPSGIESPWLRAAARGAPFEPSHEPEGLG